MIRRSQQDRPCAYFSITRDDQAWRGFGAALTALCVVSTSPVLLLQASQTTPLALAYRRGNTRQSLNEVIRHFSGKCNWHWPKHASLDSGNLVEYMENTLSRVGQAVWISGFTSMTSWAPPGPTSPALSRSIQSQPSNLGGRRKAGYSRTAAPVILLNMLFSAGPFKQLWIWDISLRYIELILQENSHWRKSHGIVREYQNLLKILQNISRELHYLLGEGWTHVQLRANIPLFWQRTWFEFRSLMKKYPWHILEKVRTNRKCSSCLGDRWELFRLKIRKGNLICFLMEDERMWEQTTPHLSLRYICNLWQRLSRPQHGSGTERGGLLRIMKLHMGQG